MINSRLRRMLREDDRPMHRRRSRRHLMEGQYALERLKKKMKPDEMAKVLSMLGRAFVRNEKVYYGDDDGESAIVNIVACMIDFSNDGALVETYDFRRGAWVSAL